MVLLFTEKYFFFPKNTIILQKVHAQAYQTKSQKNVFFSVFVLIIAFTVTFNLAFRANPSRGFSIPPLVQFWVPPTTVPSWKIWSIYSSKLFQLGNQMWFEWIWVATLGLFTAEYVKSTRLKTFFSIF